MELFTRPPIEVIYYTAGFIDGGGSVYWVEGQNRFGLVLNLSELDRYDSESGIKWLHSAWGVGRVSLRRVRRPGRNVEYISWCWTVNATKEIQFVLSNCLPYLHAKREVAGKALEHIAKGIAAGRNYRWTPAEEKYILTTDASLSEVAEQLGRSEWAIKIRLIKLGVPGRLRRDPQADKGIG